MKGIAWLPSAVLLLLCTQISIAGFSQTGQANYYILRAAADAVPGIVTAHGLTLVKPPNRENVSIVMQADTRTPDQVVAEVSADPTVDDIDYNRRLSMKAANAQPSASPLASALAGRTPVNYYGTTVWQSYMSQGPATLIRLNDVQPVATGSGIVAVIDTGVDPAQPALQGVLVPGYDFVHDAPGIPSELSDLNQSTAAILDQSTAAILDKNTVVVVNQSTAAILDQSTAAILDITQLPSAFGHGTMVAGIIHLVAPTAQIMPLKAFNADGTADLADIVSAIYYAVDNGARVINMSFSLPDFSLSLMKAVNHASANGVILTASVGNEGTEALVYPAGFQNVIGVAATDALDRRSSFSNFGAALVRMAAPGEDILTIYPGGNYALVSGTSFAAPFVAGGAALLVQAETNLDGNRAFAAFLNSKKITRELGFGRLDLYSAVRALGH